MENTDNMNHSDKAVVISLGVVFMLLSIVATILRCWARSIVRSRYMLSDWLIFPALFCCVVAGIAMILCAEIGNLGSHMTPSVGFDGQPIHTIVYRNYGLSKWFLQVFATITIGLTKMSLLALYRQIFPTRAFRIALYVTGSIVLAWTLSYSVGLIFQCTPVSAFWDYFGWQAPLFCFNQLPFYLSLTITDIITDMIIVILPMPMVWKLHLPVTQKFAVGGMFLLGALVCAAGYVRLAMFFTVNLATPDYTYVEAPTVYWTYIESSLGVVGACLPTLRPIFVRKQIQSSRGYSYGYAAEQLSRSPLTPGVHNESDHSVTQTILTNTGKHDRSFGVKTNVERISMVGLPVPRNGIHVEHRVSNDSQKA